MDILRNFLAVSVALVLLGCPCATAQSQSVLKLRTVVIDPGHGGKDLGCSSKDGKVLEKDIVLDIGKRLQKKIKAGCPDVKPIITRDKDFFVTLQGRADIANKNEADLFISIHVNSVEGKKTGPNGYSIHTLGQYTSKKRDLYAGNMAVVRRENSVILLEDDYTTKYEGFDPNDPESYIFMNLMQNAYLEQSLRFAQYVDMEMKGGAIRNSRGISQDPFYVLWKTAMPAVLIECGFMSNPNDRAVLNSEKGRERIANEIYAAFVKYKNEYEGVKTEEKVPQVSGAEPVDTAVSNAAVDTVLTDDDSQIFYGAQVLASSKSMSTDDPFFRGYEVRKFKVGNIYKYLLGVSSDRSEAQKKFSNIKKYFKDAFFVKVEKGIISAEK